MAYSQADKSYLGVGKVFIKKNGGVMRFLANATALNLSVTEDTKELQDYTEQGGGTRNSISRVTGMDIGLTLTDITPENIALAINGSLEASTAGTVTNELVTAYLNAVSPLEFIGAHTAIVTNEAGDVTYIEGTDYELTGAGVMATVGGAIVDESIISVSYSYDAQVSVEALTDSSNEYGLIFDGINEAQSGSPRVVEFYRVKFNPTAGMGYISDDFDSLELSAKVLKDSSKPSGKSAYYRDVQKS